MLPLKRKQTKKKQQQHGLFKPNSSNPCQVKNLKIFEIFTI